MHAFILLAAGSGNRMQGSLDDKVLAPLAGKPALLRCVQAVIDCGLPGPLLITVRDVIQRLRVERLLENSPALQRVEWVQGGRERRDSVRHALARLPEATELVFIHDCARPLLTPDWLRSLESHAHLHGSAVAARRVTDTLKEAEVPDPTLPSALRTLDRSRIWAMETPQVFRAADLLAAYAHAFNKHLPITDDAAALEAAGYPVALWPTPSPNPKLTTPADIPWVEYLLASHS